MRVMYILKSFVPTELSVVFIFCLDSAYKNTMSRRPQLINLTNDSKETWKVAIRIINIWILNRSLKPTLEMILRDKEVIFSRVYNV